MAGLVTFAALGMLYYLISAVVLHFLRPDYTLLQSPMSYYAVGPNGFLETSAFVLDGFSLLALAIGLYGSFRPTRRSRWSLVLLGWVGVGRILEAVFPTDVPPGPVPRTVVGEIPTIIALVVFSGVVIAALVLSTDIEETAT